MSDAGSSAGEQAEPAADAAGRGWGSRVELVAAIVLGLAAVFTAFAAYRASLTDDEVLKGYSEAAQAAQEGYDQLSAGDQAYSFEQNLFLQYAIEISAGNDEGAAYLRDTMSPELLAAVEVWEADPDDSIPTPFDGDYVELDDLESSLYYAEGNALLDEADALRVVAEDADEKSDIFELSTVLLAVTLFLAGVAALIAAPKVSWGLIGLGSLMLLGGVVVLIQAEMT